MCNVCHIFEPKQPGVCLAKVNARKKRNYQIVATNCVKDRYPPPIGGFDFSEQVNYVVGLAKVVLNVVVFGGDSQLNKLVLERSALLKETMHFTFYFHITKR
jgi:hypothetical protein